MVYMTECCTAAIIVIMVTDPTVLSVILAELRSIATNMILFDLKSHPTLSKYVMLSVFYMRKLRKSKVQQLLI
jgi:hypothetical protein